MLYAVLMNSNQELELLDEVLFALDNKCADEAENLLDATTVRLAKAMRISVDTDDIRVVAALAYEQIIARDA